MKILSTPSPNQDARPVGTVPSLVVIHGTAGSDAGDIAYLRDLSKDKEGKSIDTSASYHYHIGRDGTIRQLVPEKMRAWHAGDSMWDGRKGVNSFSIGIGLGNWGPDKTLAYYRKNPYPEAYTVAQMESLVWLCKDIMARYPEITASRFVGHHQVSPGRKTDPWGHFDWERFLGALIKPRQPINVPPVVQPPGPPMHPMARALTQGRWFAQKQVDVSDLLLAMDTIRAIAETPRLEKNSAAQELLRIAREVKDFYPSRK